MSVQQHAITADHNDHEENEVHVEIEHITGDDNELDTEETLNAVGQDEVGQSLISINGGSNVKDTKNGMGRRTVILPHQKKILEDFFKTGMNSASHQLKHLHEAAADQTGLDLHVIKNWVRNRRRPIAAQKRQEMQMMMLTMGPTPPPPPAGPSAVPSSISTMSSVPAITHIHTPPPLATPEPKRLCTDRPIDTLFTLTVKVRVADSEETDFVEVELESISYFHLLKASCEELGLSISDVAKVRKLPNVLVRKDKDVARMNEGQEIELVLKSAQYLTNPAMSYTPPNLINFSVQDGIADHRGNTASN